MDTSHESSEPKRKPHRPFRRAVLRGLAILMPPLLTIALFIWAWSVVETSVLRPVESLASDLIAFGTRDGPGPVPTNAKAVTEGGSVVSYKLGDREYFERSDGTWVGYYTDEYIRTKHLQRRYVLPLFISVFLLVSYMLGKFVAAGVGRMLVNSSEVLIQRLPLISNVYGSVKQVTDFVLSEREIEFNRVVAVEYPRKGIWSIGFVTGESMADIRAAANEPVLSVLMPTSPMPVTGFTITVLKSEAVDLNITVDQAIQFVVSCGVVVPKQQQRSTETERISNHVSAAIAQHGGGNGSSGNGTSADQRDDSLESSS
ncbi:MAG: DUF502 domain-containing protein [Planctomycetota bacterium]|nr:DUF502 domain-containing protein [Planctomycetota bacterium]